MIPTGHPTIAGCNYHSADGELKRIHAAHLSIDTGLDDEALGDALDELESVLDNELTHDGEFVSGLESQEAIDVAEAAVIEVAS